MNEMHETIVRWTWTVMSAMGGSVTSVAIVDYKKMSRNDILVMLASSMFFALFVGPFVAEKAFGIDSATSRPLCAVVFLMGAGCPTLLPPLLTWLGSMLKRLLGTGEPK